MRRIARLMLLLAALVASAAFAGTASAGSITNGGFETGSFFGWGLANQAGGSGSWYVQGAPLSPLNGFTVPAPPEGNHAAMTDQGAPGSHVLYQTLPVAWGDVLSFWVYYRNNAGVFCTPASLDYGGGCNQQYRVDIMTPSSSLWSVASGDVLSTPFQTQVGDPTSLAPTLVTVSLNRWACTFIRLRAAETDNQSFFNAGLDGVQIAHQQRPPQEHC
jgi:hypothetical protein